MAELPEKVITELHKTNDPRDEVEEFEYDIDVAKVGKYKDPHNLQQIRHDVKGVIRFRENAIVRYLLDNGPFDLNHLAMQEFSGPDREQFAQLIGYSVSGFGDLSYASTDTTYKADQIAEKLYKETK